MHNSTESWKKKKEADVDKPNGSTVNAMRALTYLCCTHVYRVHVSARVHAACNDGSVQIWKTAGVCTAERMGPLRMFIVNANQGTSTRSLPVPLNSFGSSPNALGRCRQDYLCQSIFCGTVMMRRDWCPLKFVLPAASQLSVM